MNFNSLGPIPLDDGDVIAAATTNDARPRMPEMLPVKLVTVEDAHLIGGNGTDKSLSEFYVKILGFERAEINGGVIFRAENFRLIFTFVEPPIARTDMRTLGIEVASLRQIEQKLIAAEIEYARQKALSPGQESLLFQDPAGNWIELVDGSAIR